MVLSRRQGKVLHALNAQLVPHGAKVLRLVKLHFVGHSPGAKALIVRVLQIPAGLIALDELSNDSAALLSLSLGQQSPPHLQVLDRIASLVLGGALPSNDIRRQGREAELEDVRNGKCADYVADGGIDDRNPGR